MFADPIQTSLNNNFILSIVLLSILELHPNLDLKTNSYTQPSILLANSNESI